MGKDGERENLITVIVLSYNVAPYLPICFSGLLRQSAARFDLIIIDDGSTDDSGAICRDFAQNSPYTRFFSRNHEGVSAARNYGLSQVRTDYVLFVDGDDYLEPDAIERLYEIVNIRRPDLVIYGFFYETKGSKDRYPVAARTEYDATRQDMERRFPEIWDAGLMYSVCNKLFRTDLILNNGLLFETRTFGEDAVFCREYLKYCRNMAVLGSCLYHYICQRPDSLSNLYRPDLFDIRVREHRDLTRYFRGIQCDRAILEETLARRHIERVVGCIANECSPDSKKSVREKWKAIHEFLIHPDTEKCAEKARSRSRKMKIIICLIRKKRTTTVLFLGYVMSFCGRKLPRLFVRLKANR